MPDQLLFDKLRFIDRLTHAGVAEEQARAHAEAMEEALREAVATKSDIATVRSDIGNDITAVRSDIAAVRSDVSREIAQLDHKIDLAVRDMTIRMGGMMVAAVAVLAAIKYFG
jgi:hypothetical protein